MNRKQTYWAAIAAAMLTSASAPFAGAQGSDALLNKLVQKGILTSEEAKDLKQETDKGFNQAIRAKTGMPDWVNSWKLGGDFRGRYESFQSDNPLWVQRDRFRYRARFGITASLLDNFEVGLRLGSGDPATGFTTGNPLSANSTLQDNATRKMVYLDLAYAKWTPFHTDPFKGSLTIGKMENPFTFSQMVFDPDYNPEGAAAQWTCVVGHGHTLKGTLAGFVLDELSGSGRDPFLGAAQVTLDSQWNKHLATSIGGGVLGISSLESLNNGNVPNINRGNTRNAAGAPAYHFNPVVADASLTYTLDSFPLYPGAFPIKPMGEFLHNPAAGTKNQACMGGIQFGKAAKKGQWELSYQYRYLGADSWYEELPDDDFGAFYQVAQPNSAFGSGYGGGTNVRGHVVKATYAILNSLGFTITWYNGSLIDRSPPGAKSDMHHLLVDLMWKF